MRDNLESFFQLQYPNFEIIFSTAEPDPQLESLIQELMERYPNIHARFIRGETASGIHNPKVSNLTPAYEAASGDWIWISDSNTRVDPHYLSSAISQWKADTGIMTSVIAGVLPIGVWGEIESIHINNFYSRSMMIADAFGKSCVMGKSMLFRKSDLNRLGGIRHLSPFLAEDFITGEMIKKLGYKVQIQSDPIPQIVGHYSFSTLWKRHVRWGRLRKTQAPHVFFVEFFSFPLIGSLLMVLGSLQWLLGAGYLGSTLFLDYLTHKKLNQNQTSILPGFWFIHWLLKEILTVPMYVASWAGNTVEWRGRKMQLSAGGVIHD